jgi:hypothetical protein
VRGGGGSGHERVPGWRGLRRAPLIRPPGPFSPAGEKGRKRLSERRPRSSPQAHPRPPDRVPGPRARRDFAHRCLDGCGRQAPVCCTRCRVVARRRLSGPWRLRRRVPFRQYRVR